MPRKLICIGVLVLIISKSLGQDKANLNANPIVIAIQFHSVRMPFQKIGDHFKNVGIGIGTEIWYKVEDQTLAQSVKLVWQRNSKMGNSVQLYTQLIYRPKISGSIFGESRIGLGYHYMFRPVDSFEIKGEGWKNVGKRGKGMLMIPSSLGTGFLEDQVAFSTNYQWVILKGFNTSIPLFPISEIMVSSGVY